MKRQSRYEKWCATNLTVPSQAHYGTYPTVSLGSYGAYFKTGDGRGLAEYSNANFVTESTNYSDVACPPFDFPKPALAKTSRRTQNHTVTRTRFAEDGAHLEVVSYEDDVLTFVTQDAYTGAAIPNQNHSFFSYFDYELQKEQKKQVYSLPASALAAQAELLVPRAVGYSAGILDHFFRGNIDAKWKRNLNGTWNLTITNLSHQDIGPDAGIEVFFRATPKYLGTSSDLRTILSGSMSSLTSFSGLAPGQSVVIENITVEGIKDGDLLTDFERRIVMTGTLGSEPHAVIPLVQPGSVPIDELTIIASWSDLLPVVFSARDPSEDFLPVFTWTFTFQSSSGHSFTRWPESTLRFAEPVAGPHLTARPSPVVFHTTRVPMSKSFFVQAFASMGSFFWMQSNLKFQAYVGDKLVHEETCPETLPLVDMCRYSMRCRDGTCTFTRIP